jgi:hypothetical protein
MAACRVAAVRGEPALFNDRSGCERDSRSGSIALLPSSAVRFGAKRKVDRLFETEPGARRVCLGPAPFAVALASRLEELLLERGPHVGVGVARANGGCSSEQPCGMLRVVAPGGERGQAREPLCGDPEDVLTTDPKLRPRVPAASGRTRRAGRRHPRGRGPAPPPPAPAAAAAGDFRPPVNPLGRNSRPVLTSVPTSSHPPTLAAVSATEQRHSESALCDSVTGRRRPPLRDNNPNPGSHDHSPGRWRLNAEGATSASTRAAVGPYRHRPTRRDDLQASLRAKRNSRPECSLAWKAAVPASPRYAHGQLAGSWHRSLVAYDHQAPETESII